MSSQCGTCNAKFKHSEFFRDRCFSSEILDITALENSNPTTEVTLCKATKKTAERIMKCVVFYICIKCSASKRSKETCRRCQQPPLPAHNRLYCEAAFTHDEIEPNFYSKYWSVIQPILGDEPILFVIQPVTINTMLNNWLNNRAEFRYV